MKNWGTALFVLAIAFTTNAFVTSAYADEPNVSQYETALTERTISGGDMPWYNTSDSSVGTDGTALAPLTPSASFAISPVPEPSAIGLSVAGVLTLVAFATLKRRSSQANE
jgi:hypothetical protein